MSIVLNWLKTRSEDRCKAKELYGVIVTGARQPAFYAECGVEDTPEGRYEMIALHLFLVIERLKGAGPQADRVAQRVMETFVTDMDDSMREMGVGDLSVGKKVKRSAAGLYERFRAYRGALAQPGDALADEIAAFVPGVRDGRAIAGYVMQQARELKRLETDAVLSGQVHFAQPLKGAAA
jgi:cytochrome b pre-mRNA-processing protein 3